MEFQRRWLEEDSFFGVDGEASWCGLVLGFFFFVVGDFFSLLHLKTGSSSSLFCICEPWVRAAPRLKTNDSVRRRQSCPRNGSSAGGRSGEQTRDEENLNTKWSKPEQRFFFVFVFFFNERRRGSLGFLRIICILFSSSRTEKVHGPFHFCLWRVDRVKFLLLFNESNQCSNQVINSFSLWKTMWAISWWPWNAPSSK